MRSNIDDANVSGTRQFATRYASAELTITGDYTILPTSPIKLMFDGGSSDRTIRLPEITPDGGQEYWIFNVGTTNSLTIVDANGITVTAIAASTSRILSSFSTGTWVDFGGGGAFVIPSALTKVDDTNVTLTLSGTPATALLQDVTLTLGWTGTLALSRFAQGSDGQLIVGQTAAAPAYKTITGDWTLSAAGAATLATVNANVGSFGDATHVAAFTVNAKGLITAASAVAIVLASTSISDFTEAAQDAIGAALTDTATIDFTYNDVANTITADVIDNSITYAKMQDVSVTSRFIGRITAGAGDPEELTGANAKTIIGSGDLTKVDDTNVTLALGGTPVGALYSAVSLTLGWTGQLSLARGGTGANLVDPNADRIFFWDDSAGATDWLIPGNSIAITTTTLDTIQDIRTTASPQFAGINVGAASDTTITRQSAGHLAVEGATIWDSGNDGSGSGLDADLLDGKNTGTSGNVVPLLDGTNTWSALQIMTLGSAAANEPLRLINTTDNASVQVLELQGDRATMAANDEAYVSMILSDSAGNQDEFARVTWKGVDVTSTSNDARLIWSVAIADSLTAKMRLEGSALTPDANDGTALGTTALMWSDLFLASGAVINFNNGNMTITHAAASLTVAGGAVSIGTANAFTCGTIELGAASDTTLARSGAGDVSIEGNAIYRAGGTDVALADGGTGASLVDPNIDRVMMWDDSAGAVKFAALTDLNTEATPAAGDYILMYDAAGNLLKTDWSNVSGAASGVSSFNTRTGAVVSVAGDYDSTQIYKENIANCRITLSTGVQVMASSVTGATTVYVTPYQGNLIPIYDGTRWSVVEFTELSQATTDSTKSPAAVAATQVYDIFVWSDGGTIRATRGPTWASGTGGSNTVRGTGAGSTELQLIKGLWTNKNSITNGPAANRGTYVGTIASNGTSTIDFIFGGSASGGSAARLMVWNNFNRRQIATTVVDTATAYTLISSTVRQANASSGNQVNFVVGLAEDAWTAYYDASFKTAAVNGAWCYVGIGVDSTSSETVRAYKEARSNVTVEATQTPVLSQIAGLGIRFVAATEHSDGTDTSTLNTDSLNTLGFTLLM